MTRDRLIYTLILLTILIGAILVAWAWWSYP